jgi:hypothetical protein
MLCLQASSAAPPPTALFSHPSTHQSFPPCVPLPVLYRIFFLRAPQYLGPHPREATQERAAHEEEAAQGEAGETREGNSTHIFTHIDTHTCNMRISSCAFLGAQAKEKKLQQEQSAKHAEKVRRKVQIALELATTVTSRKPAKCESWRREVVVGGWVGG